MTLSKVVKFVVAVGALSTLSGCLDGDFSMFMDDYQRSIGYQAEGIPGLEDLTGGFSFGGGSSAPAPLPNVPAQGPVPSADVNPQLAPVAGDTVPVNEAVEIFL